MPKKGYPMQHLLFSSVFTLCKRLIMGSMILLHPLWAAGTINICLHHDQGADCAKLSVSIPHLQEGRPFQKGDRFSKKLHDTSSVISLSYEPPKNSHSLNSPYSGNLRVISTQQAQRDKEGNFLHYDLPLIYNPTYIDDKEGIRGIIFPFTPEKSGWVSYELSKTVNKTTWKWIEGYSYRPLRGEHGFYEAQKFNKAALHDTMTITSVFIQSKKQFIKNPQRSYAQKELTPIRFMPFSNEVSVFGTVWTVCDMWARKFNEIEESNPTWEALRVVSQVWAPLNVFPKMTEQQFEKMDLGKSRTYRDYYHSAFFDPNHSILCFFPTDKKKKSQDQMFTSRSLDSVAHETGHYILNHMAPRIATSSNIYAQAFNESFADCTAYFFLLQFQDRRDLIYDKTKGYLEGPSFFSIIGKGLVGRHSNLIATPLEEINCEEHHLSEAFTKAIYGTLVKAVDHEIDTRLRDQRKTYYPSKEEVSAILAKTSHILMRVYLRAVLSYNDTYNPSEDFNFVEFGRHLWAEANKETSSFSNFIARSFFKEGFDLDNANWRYPANCSRSSSERSGVRCDTLAFLMSHETV